jgi:hypothetical protein
VFDNTQTVVHVERLTWQWVLCNEKALADTREGGRLLAIRYEDLCGDPVGVTHRMFAFTGLDLSPRTRRFLAASTSSHHSRYYSVYKDPARAAAGWKQELPGAMRERVAGVAADTAAGRLFSDLL